MKIFLTAILIFISSTAWATTWYVRDGGGTATQCTGTTNAVYPGSGSGIACAFNHPRWLLGWDLFNNNPGVMAGGDIAYVDGDSDINSGQQAKYLIGNDTTGGTTPTCGIYDGECTLYNIPAGTNGSPTSIIGTGTHKPLLYGHRFPGYILQLNNSYVTLQWLEVTDDQACAYQNSGHFCVNNDSGNRYPDGIQMAGDQITLTDVYVHGFGRYGISTGQMGSATFTRVWSIGNGFGGITVGNNGTTSVTGTLTFNQPIIEWNGCIEAYPMTYSGIDNPLNYSQCYGAGNNGYGDGLAFGATGAEPAGNWTVIGPGSISFNTQDGLDILHGLAGTGIDQVDKMRFEGNAGQQLKITGAQDAITNNLIIGNCGWWQGSARVASGAMTWASGDACRANNTTIRFSPESGVSASFYNNTIITNGIAFEADNDTVDTCVGTSVIIKNNIIQGGYVWGDDTSWNSEGSNGLTTNFYSDGTDGNGSGACGALAPVEDYNVVYGNKNSNYPCSGTHDHCGVAPGLTAGLFPAGTAGGAANTYYQGFSGVSLLPISSGSAARGAGVSGLYYWNTATDYYNVTRSSTPSIGGLEYASCAATGYGCFLNSDCCSDVCNSVGTCSSSSVSSMSTTTSLAGSTKITGKTILQ